MFEINVSFGQCRITAESDIAAASIFVHIDIILYVVAFHLAGEVAEHALLILHVDFLEADDVSVPGAQKSHYGVGAFLSG